MEGGALTLRLLCCVPGQSTTYFNSASEWLTRRINENIEQYCYSNIHDQNSVRRKYSLIKIQFHNLESEVPNLNIYLIASNK